MTAPFSLEKKGGLLFGRAFFKDPGVWGWETPKDKVKQDKTYNRRKRVYETFYEKR